MDIPRRSCDRKVNEFVKRVRACLTHAKICAHLRAQMPAMMGHESKQKKLLANIEGRGPYSSSATRTRCTATGSSRESTDQFRRSWRGCSCGTWTKVDSGR